MSLAFRLSVAIFVFILQGLGMFWLSVGIVGKKVRTVPFLLYAVFSAILYLLSAYSFGWVLDAPAATINLFELIVTLISATIEVAVLGILIWKCYDISVLQGIEAAILARFVLQQIKNCIDYDSQLCADVCLDSH